VTTVNVYPFHDDASAQYRLILPGRALAAAGHDVIIYSPEELINDPAKAEAVRGSDLAVMNRPDSEAAVDFIRQLQAQGTKVLVDMDDLLGYVSPKHSMAGRADVLHHWAMAACYQADWITASTPVIALEYGRDNIFEPCDAEVVPNRVPASYLSIPRRPGRNKPEYTPIIGWSGTVATHPVDLLSTGGTIGRFLRRNPAWSFGVVGPVEEARVVAHQLGIQQQIRATGWVDFADYPAWLANFDIGIVPLRLTKFNNGKSWLKAIEMAAVGAHVVMSATDENKRLYREYGVGHLATNPVDWHRQLNLLVTSEQPPEPFPRSLTIEGALDQWREAWGL
jgi:glycosyltransferase involved in cell wall biosynthesis